MLKTVPTLSPLSVQDWQENEPGRPWLVLIHGWGCHSAVWQNALPVWAPHFRLRCIDLPGFGLSAALHWPDTDTLLDWLIDALPGHCHLLGWSLGGQLATLLAERCPRRIEALITIASNPHFLAEADWPGMAVGKAAAFHRLIRDQGNAGLTRFALLLAHGDRQERQVLERLQALNAHQPPGTETLLTSLDTLEQLDTRTALDRLELPVTHILAEADALVPTALAHALQGRYPQQRVHHLPGLGHAPFLSRPEALLPALQQARQPAKRQLQTVAQRFSQSAAHYDAAAELQRQTGLNALQHLPLRGDERVLDLGCGTGFCSQQLLSCWPDLTLIASDLAEGMARITQQHAEVHALVHDAEQLPFADACFDAVVSNCVLQWCRVPQVLREVRRVLKPGGRFLFTAFSDGTLQELRQAFARLDDDAHVNHFPSLTDWQQWAADWQVHRLDRQQTQRSYPALRGLLQELKHLGANHVHQRRSAGLKGRAYWQGLEDAYPARTTDGHCLARWETVTGLLEKPAS